ncbi:MAG: PKD domain-containing protein [Pseudomonadales bacterium]
MQSNRDRKSIRRSGGVRRALGQTAVVLLALASAWVHAATNVIGSADGSFETGLTGTTASGDASLISGIGILDAIEGDQSLLLTTEPDSGATPADASVSTLLIENFTIGAQYATLRLNYNFLTDEPDPSYANDAFTVKLVLVTAGGEQVVLSSDTFDTFFEAPWTGYGLQTGFRTMVADVSGIANGTDLVSLELRIEDIGDGRRNSAVLVDDIRLVEPGTPEARVSASYLQISPGQNILFDGTGSTDDVGIVSYYWNFDNGYVGSGPLISFNQYTTPGVHQGTLTVTDADGYTDTATFSVVVGDINTAPTIVSAANVAAAEGVPYRYQIVASDPQVVLGDTLTYALISGPAGMAVDPDTGLVSWTPPIGAPSRTDVSVQVTDSLGASDSQSYTIAMGPEVMVAGARDDGIIYTARSLGDGTFDSFQQLDNLGSTVRGSAIADFDGDDDFDLIVGRGQNPSQHLYLYRREGGDFLAPVYLGSVGDSGASSGSYAEDMAAEDFNEDGRMDVVVNGDSTNSWLLKSTGPLVIADETFFASDFETGDEGWGGAAGNTAYARDDTTSSSGDWSMRVYATATNSQLSIDINPTSWNYASGSRLRFDYRIPAGTPVGMLFNVSGVGWVQLGGTTTANPFTYPVSPLAVTLVDDDAWHTAEIDLFAAIRAVSPSASGISEFQWYTYNNGVAGDQFWFDNVQITRPRMVSGFETSLLPNISGNSRGADAGDANRDGRQDLVRAVYSSGYVYLYLGDGAGNLTPVASPVIDAGTDPYGVVLADFDNDGVPDLLANEGSGGDPYLYLGNGDGTFQAGSYVASLDTNNYTSYGAYDFNGDGNQDMVTANYSSRQLSYFPGNGDGTFGASVLVGTAGSSMLSVAAPAGRIIGQPFARATQDAETVDEIGTVNFDATTSYDDGSIVSYDWNFGDGTFGSGELTAHTYLNEGVYDVVLGVTDNDGEKDTFALRVTVNGNAPVADAGGSYLLGERNALNGRWHGTLDGTGSTDTEGAIALYQWDFDASDGIGVDAEGPYARPTYDAPGSYTVTLTVTDQVGQTNATTATVVTQTNDAPTANLTGSATLDENEATLGQWTGWYDAAASTDVQGLASYLVDWGDGDTHTFAPLADDFDDGNLTGWTVYSGTWGVSNGEAYQTAAGAAWRWLQDLTRSYRDFELEVDFKALSTASDAYMGIVFRNPNTSNNQNTFLMYSLDGWDYWRFYDWQSPATILADGGTGWDPGIWYHLRLRVVGDTMQLYVTPEGGTETLQVEATSAAHPEGGVGLLAYNLNLRYDNVKVTPLDTAWKQDGVPLDFVYHRFTTAGDYDVTLTVADHGGQTDTVVIPTSVTANDPPAADAGGPYVLDEADAYNTQWEFALDASASTDDVGISRYTVDFGDGTAYTSGVADGTRTQFFAVGTDLYGYDTPSANLQRVIATEDGTLVEIVNLQTRAVVASTTLNRFGYWNTTSPGDGIYYKVRASKPVVAYFTNLGNHSTFMPSLDGSPVGHEFIFAKDNNSGFYVYAHDDTVVDFYGTNGTLAASMTLRAGEYQVLSVGDTIYRAVSSGRVSMQTTGPNGYTTVPADNGDGTGRLFYFATQAGSGAIAAFAHEAADVEVFDLDSGTSLYTGTVAAGSVWYQTGVGARRLRLVSTGDVEVWAGDMEGGTSIDWLGDDISFAGGSGGTDFVLHNLMDGIVIFAPTNGTEITIDGTPTATLQRDEYLALAPSDFATGSGVHHVVTSQPVVIQTLGRANTFNDLGTYLGGVSMRHRYAATGLYTVQLTVTDSAGQTDTTTTTVDVQANDPPVPVIDAPAIADEGFATGGTWSVDFDASGSSDDFGIARYEWDFGDGATGTGEQITHGYTATGTYVVTLTTTDHAGQSVSTTFSIDVTLGDGPVADAGGPYTFGEESASYGVWTATLDGTGSTDDTGIYDYRWEFPPNYVDDFEDGVIDTDLWVTGANTTEAGGRLSITGAGWGTTGFYATGGGIVRQPGAEMRMQVLGTSGYMMVGLFNPAPTNFSYTNMSHALYFYNGSLYVYEDGSQRGLVGSYTFGTLYEVRIVLLAAGAEYYIREVGASTWTPLTNFTSYGRSASPLRPGAAVNTNTWSFDNTTASDYAYGAIVTREYRAPTTVPVTLRVRDNALQESYDSTTIEIVDGDAPVAEAAGPYTAEVGSYVNFNGAGSTDDNAVEQYHWRFGEFTAGPDAPGAATARLEFTGKGATPRHFYKAVGTYPIELEVTDNTLKTASDTTTVDVIVGDPPVAAVRPATLGGINGPPVYFDGTQSTDDFGIVEYRWDFDATYDRDGDGNPANDLDAVGATPYWTYDQATGPAGALLSDDFEGPALDSTLWTSSNATQGGGVVTLTGAINWSTRYIGSVQTFDRSYKQSFRGSVRQAPGTAQMMVGVKIATASANYTTMPHAIYFNNGTLQVYENGSNRGTVNNFTYTVGTSYDFRIDPRPAGARYYLRQTGTSDWTQLAGFTTTNPTSSPLNLFATVYSGTAELDNFAVEGAGDYVVVLTVEDGAGQTSTVQTSASVAVNAAPDVITVPWVAFDPLVPHEVYNGKAIRLKGIVRDADPATYQWDFGDGTSTGPVAVSNKYDLSVLHTYPTAPVGTPFTATLTVTDSAGNVGSATYPVIVRPLNLTTEINVAIDEGLWYLHQQQTRTTAEGFDIGYWTSNARASATASSIQAFQVNGHLESVSHQEDPYAETVARGLRQLFRDLGTVDIATQTNGEPDTNGNGIGIQTGLNGSGGQPIYQGGQVMDAIASSGNPLARTVTGATGILRRSYFDILTDMVDQFAWGQVDSGYYQGGWRYGWNSDSDNSAAQWGAIGTLAAEDIFAIPVPQWVKDMNLLWLDNYGNPGWGYTGGAATPAGTPSGLVQMAFDDRTTDDQRWIDSEAWIAQTWTTNYITSPGNRPYYPYYALTKAMRLAKPAPVEFFSYNGFDWFRDEELGLARTLIDDQNTTADGSFPGSSNIMGQLRSAWGVIILSRTLFVQPPVADAGRDRVWGVDIPLTFDGSGSYHLDPFRSLVKYEWDFDGDGVFDYSSSEPTATYTYTRADYPEATLPQTITARLRVTDNNIPALTDTDTVQIIVAVPPHPPVADAGGPYTCTAGLPCVLDGSGSFDIDPTDFISLYEWDLDGFPFDYTGPTGVNPEGVFTEGLHNISVRVYDNAVLNDVNGNGVQDPEERLTDVAFSSVTAVANQAPIANANGPYTVDEGSSVVLSSAGSSDPNGDPLTFEWNFDSDGLYDDALGPNPSFPGVDDGDYPVELRVTDTLLDATSATTVTVLNVAPSVNAGPDTSVPEGSTVNFTGSFTDPGTADTHTYAWDFGDGSALVTDTLTPSHNYPDNGSYTVTLTVTDDDGGVGSDTLTVNVTDLAPTAALSGDQALTEGDAGSYDASASTSAPDAIAGFEWDYAYDGSFTPSGDTGATTTHRFPENGSFTVAVRVTDDDGSTDIATLVVSVANANPVVNAGADQTDVVAGSTVTLDPASFTDAGIEDTHTATIDWGDGSAAVAGTVSEAGGSGTVGGSHVFATPGTYTVTVTVTDDDLGAGSDTLQVSVVASANNPPVVDAGTGATIDEGQTFIGGGSFTDPDDDTWTATVDYGDGSGVQSLALNADKTFALSHQYLDNGSYTVTVTVTDSRSGVGSDTVTVQVNDLGPTAALTGDQTLTEGDTGSYDATGSVSAPDTIAGYEWDYAYDGTFTPSGDTGPTASHTFPEDGTYTVAVRVTDDDGSTDIATLAVMVSNARPVVDAGPDQSGVTVGDTVSLAPATFTDAGVEDTHTATIDWGDGSAPEAGTVAQGAGSGSVSGSHSYAAAGDYTVTVTVTDDEGDSGSDTLVVSVSEIPNTAPAVDAGAGATIDEGDTFIGGGSFTDPDDDTWTATVDYGDGSGVQVLALNADKTFALSHQYLDDGLYTVTVTVSDGTDSGSDTVSVTVNDLGPTAALTGDQTLTEGDTGSYDASGSTSFPDAIVRYEWDWAYDGTFDPSGDEGVTSSHTFTAEGGYTVAVRVTDEDGSTDVATLAVTVEPIAVEPPPAPTDLVARPKSTKVQLVWTYTGADSYNVYRSTTAGGPYTLIANTTSTYSTYLDEGLANEITYYYVVTAVVSSVESTTPSNEASAMPSARIRTR